MSPTKVKSRSTKTRMGRPPIAAEDKRGTLVKVLVTDTEKERMEALAQRRGLTVSTWLRSLGLEALERAQETR